MNHLQLVSGVLLLILALHSSTLKGEDNITTSKHENVNGNSTENEKSFTVLSENEMVLDKWRKMERILKTIASKSVKSTIPYILRLSEEISISSECTSSMMKMIFGMKDMKLWAYQMLDASGKTPNGIFNGWFSSLGDYDGCLSVKVPGSKPFSGQYCSVFFKPPLPKWKPFHKVDDVLPLFVNFTKKGTLLEDITRKAHFFFHEVRLRTSICVPSTCSIEDIRSIVDRVATEVEFPWNVTIPSCDITEPLVFSKSDVFIMCLLGIFVLLAFIATVTDVVLNVYSKEKRSNIESSSTAVKCLMCFSTYTNTLRLLKKDNSPNTIKIFHGLKFITLLWVMMNHTYYYYMNITLFGFVQNAREFGRSIPFQVVANGFFNVETFFFISAVLVAYGRMKHGGKHISIPLYLFRRVWRLTPPLMLIIAASILVPHMGTGPGWKDTVEPQIDRCRVNWWTNLLYINNFLKSENMCYQWLWYIPVDTHLYVLALFVIIPLKSRPRLAFGINIFLFTAGIITTAATHVYYGLHPTAIYVYSDIVDRHYFTDNSFFRTYTHLTTTCIGLSVGYILATTPKLKIPKILNICGWFSSLILSLLVVYGVYDWNQGNIPGLFVSTLYACTSKIVWALALSYVTIACFTGNGGVVSSILSWQGLVPFSRLTYVTYIIHPIIQMMYIASTRVPIQMDHRTCIYRTFGNIVAAYSCAYVVSLIVESPFMCLEKVMFLNRLTPKSSKKFKPEEEGEFRNGIQFNNAENSVSVINVKKTEELSHA